MYVLDVFYNQSCNDFGVLNWQYCMYFRPFFLNYRKNQTIPTNKMDVCQN